MNTSLKTIDFDAIFQELLKAKRSFSEVRQYTVVDFGWYLNDYAMVWIGAPRQCGKTTWAIEKLCQEPSGVMVVVNSAVRDNVLQKLAQQNVTRPVLTVKEVLDELRLPDAPQRHSRLMVVDDAYYALARLPRNRLIEWTTNNGTEDVTILMLTT